MAATEPSVAYTRTLSDYALAIRADQVPEDVRHEVGRITLDALGCAVAGLVTPAGQIAVDLVREERGPLQARVIGAGEASVGPAVFANAVLTNAIDFDVYGPEGHVAPVVLPVALALAEAVGASGPQLFEAIVTGMEIGGRIGGALRRPGHEGGRPLGAVRGHGHVVFGAVAAAGRLLGLTQDQMHHAFGIAGYSATVPTLRKFFASPHAPMTKYDHLGLMSQNGVQAALLAQRGFTGDLEVLEGDIGFWRFAGAQGCDWDHLINGLGSEWTIREVSYKPYPVGLYGNPGIEVTRRIVREHAIRPDEIEHVEVRTTRAGDGPGHRFLRHSLDAWENAYYTLAAGILDIRPRRAWQEPRGYERVDARALMEKVGFQRVREGELTGTGNYWERWSPARVTVRARGQTFEDGDDFLPSLDDQQLTAKFYENVEGLLEPPQAQQLEHHCRDLMALKSARELTSLFPTSVPR